ncbi:hypothetical protein BLA13014_07498 [Burkholderia aenigmatica]|uniref:Uncharacterized protein n=1 Tax=Burkholderia aenigmatica TaxID=2015348 RepID=A0A6P2SKC8_9BURK|nr:hypothetical protein BLA13014_07498 [Burkholderia aenigmatica]
MRAVERRPPRCVDDDRHRLRRDAEGRTEHVAQRGTRRGAAHRILMSHEARGPRALVIAECRIRGRRKRYAPVEIDTHDPHAGAGRGRRHVKFVHAPGARCFGRGSRIGRDEHRRAAACGTKRPMLIDRAVRRRRCGPPASTPAPWAALVRVVPACACVARPHPVTRSRRRRAHRYPFHARAMPGEAHALCPPSRPAAHRTAASTAQAATAYR